MINENWQGKSDPTERRRIQNRLNQRNYRARQRAGSSPKLPKASNQAGKNSPPDERDDDDDDDDDNDEDVEPRASLASHLYPDSRSISATAVSGRDELAQLINRNLMQAAVTNAQYLGVDMTALRNGTAVCTPRSSIRTVPAALAPTELQYRVAHDPIIDIIPHPRLRYNMLRAIATRQIDAAALSACIRSSGTLMGSSGTSQRGGLVVWSSPEQLASWELSEVFVRRWHALLESCQDLIAVTNAWRSRRGERLFPLSMQRSEEEDEDESEDEEDDDEDDGE